MPEPLYFLNVDGAPEAFGLPPEEAASVIVAAVSPSLPFPTSFVVDEDYAVMIAHAAGNDEFVDVPVNLDVVRYMRPGWPPDWAKSTAPAFWLKATPEGRWEPFTL